ncbi:MAG: TonB-dependent receptor [Hyphomonadaceae bacterium]
MSIRSFARGAAYMTALGVSSLGLMAGSAWAQSSNEPEDPITVTGQRAELDSPRYTAPLLETPQTVTIVSGELVEQQNLLGLRDILSTLPGITFGAGEGGGGYGDSINLRGYSANNDISVDGVRDSAQYTRTDPFNLEQLELTNGANSVYGGAGSLGGSVNLVTKRPSGQDRGTITGAVGTDDYGRVTLDVDRMFGESVGARLNVMVHQNDVPGRYVERFERWGIAPSITFWMNGDTRVTLQYVHQEDDNIPQYGVPYALGPFNGGALPGVPNSAYFGYANVDTQEITADSITATIEHDFIDNVGLRNLTRYQEVSQLAIVNPPQGTWCVAPGINPWTGVACATPGTFLPTGPRGTTRESNNEILINQTDFTFSFNTAGIQHTLVAGAVFSNETYHLDSGNVLRNPLGATPNPVLPVMDIGNPDNIYTGPINFIRTSFTDSEVSNQAFYVFDRLELNEQWEINGGVRFENNEGEARTSTIATPYPAPPAQPVVTPGASFGNEEELLSYRIGVVYQPIENLSFYIAHGNSETPSQATVNGACTAATCNVDPEEAVTYEIGAKWDAYGGRLSLTAALFDNQRSSFRVASGDPLVPEQQLDGSSRVRGVALGASGMLTDNWSIFANYTYLDSELEQSISDILIGLGTVDFLAGDPLPNTPEHSFSFWSTYELRSVKPGFLIGYGATYQGEYTFTRQTATTPLFYTPSHWVHRAMVSYPITERAVLQLNVNNLFDEEYFERVRNNAGNGWATPGATRSATLSLSYRF